MNALIYLPIYKLDESTNIQINQLSKQSNKNFQLIIHDMTDTKKVIKNNNISFTQIYFPESKRSVLFNRIIKLYNTDIIIPLPPNIIPYLDFVDYFIRSFSSHDIAISYSNYILIDQGKKSERKLFTWAGNIEERFQFGYVKAYDCRKVKSVGYFNESYEIMEEYDLLLRLTDKYKINHIKKTLYQAVRKKNKFYLENNNYKIMNPNDIQLNQISYLSYPYKMEKEVKKIFIKMLKRRKIYIKKTQAIVRYPSTPYKKKASVIIPVYNRVGYIQKAISSVLSGKFNDFEIIVVDNNSTDGTYQIVEKMKDSRIKLLANPYNKTIAHARNFGIENSNGKYICQLDSDDEYTDNTLEVMINFLEKQHTCGLAISYYEMIDDNSNPIEGHRIVKHLEYNCNNILRTEGAGALRVYPHVILKEFGLFDTKNCANFGEDYDMVLKISERYEILRVHEVLYKCRRHAQNSDKILDPSIIFNNKLKARKNAIERRKLFNLKNIHQ